MKLFRHIAVLLAALILPGAAYAADTTLTPTGLVQIEVGASEDSWGDKLNTNSATLNAFFGAGPALKVANGGTGATAASGARTNLGAAASGANSDITSLTAVTSSTYTPVVSFSTPGTSSFSYASQVGRYIQIGKLVVVEVALTFTPTIGTGSGVFRVSLPVTAAGADAVSGSVSVTNPSFTWGAGSSLAVGLSTTSTARIVALATGAGGTQFTQTSLTNGASHLLYFSLVYIAA